MQEAFFEGGMGEEAAAGAAGESGESTSFESVFESVKTSLPGLGEEFLFFRFEGQMQL